MSKPLAKFLEVLKWIGVVLLVLLIGWIALFSRFNIGKIIAWLLGRKKEQVTPKVLNSLGNDAGTSTLIIKSNNPFRDKSKLKLKNGVEVDLPKGVVDRDVREVVINEPEVVDIHIRHKRFTAIFNGPSP